MNDGTTNSDIDDRSESDNISSVGNSFKVPRGPSRGLFIPFSSSLKPKLRPDFENKNSNVYKLLKEYKKNDENSILKDLINHHEYTLAISRSLINKKSAFTSISLAIKDRILELLNDSQQLLLRENPKRVYFLSIEYLLGRLFQNSVFNLNLDTSIKNIFKIIGVSMEEAIETETDPGLGTAGLGRLSACFLESFASLNLPASGYGIRYTFGSFKQTIQNNKQVELADYWANDIYPWEIERSDIIYEIKFGGSTKNVTINGQQKRIWIDQKTVLAKAYDIPLPGFETLNTSNLRLWKSIPDHLPSLEPHEQGDYYYHIKAKQEAELITSVLYPNKETTTGKELQLKQEYFFVSASLQDIIKTFKLSNNDFNHFSSKVAIQLNDTHPALGIVELLRILLDEIGFNFEKSWDLVQNTFCYTNHSLFSDALEKWDVVTFGRILPRHLELIYDINSFWMEKALKVHNCSVDVLSDLSLIEETNPKQVRFGNLCVLGSHFVNGVSEAHTKILTESTFKHFFSINPGKFLNITNGVSIRRWVCVANPLLNEFYTDQLGSNDFILDFELIKTLENRVESLVFQKKFQKIKKKAKLKIVEWVKQNLKIELSEEFMFDAMMKKVHDCKRQLMFLLFIIYRYIALKKLTSNLREKVVKRVFFMSGKANPSHQISKSVIELFICVMNVINNDKEISKYMKVVFLPNYNVSIAELMIPGIDLSEHISVIGTEASGTSNMKAAMNGALIIGTKDGANVEIEKQVGSENMFLFGTDFDKLHSVLKKVV